MNSFITIIVNQNVLKILKISVEDQRGQKIKMSPQSV